MESSYLALPEQSFSCFSWFCLPYIKNQMNKALGS